VPLSELDLLVGGIALSGGDRLQDLQNLIPIATTAEQGESKVGGHELKMG